MQMLGRGAVLGTLVVLGCPAPPESAPKAVPKVEAKAPSKAETAPDQGDPKPAPVPAVPKDDGPRGAVLATAPIPLATFLGSAPAEAEALLGDPQSKGGTKDSCVRFVPDKIWFRCKHAWQRYADKTGTAETIHVTYEDGKAASIAFEKLTGEGPFDPVVALAKVGLQLPGEPTLKQPAETVNLWSWWNAKAKLLIAERQYRVEISTVDDQWSAAKVDIILNDPLNDDEKARVFEVKAQRGADAAQVPPE